MIYAICLLVSHRLISGANLKAISKVIAEKSRILKTVLNQLKLKIAIKMDGLAGLSTIKFTIKRYGTTSKDFEVKATCKQLF